MSILIKDMEMPKDCKYCKFRKTELQEDPDWCLISGESLFYLAENDCPLVEVPEDVQPVKHGRWIIDNPQYLLLHCSECQCSNSTGYKWKYCPNCGAKMS